MAATEFKYKMSDMTKNMTVELRLSGVRAFTWRIKVATWLIRLAAIVCSSKCTMEIMESQNLNDWLSTGTFSPPDSVTNVI